MNISVQVVPAYSLSRSGKSHIKILLSTFDDQIIIIIDSRFFITKKRDSKLKQFTGYSIKFMIQNTVNNKVFIRNYLNLKLIQIYLSIVYINYTNQISKMTITVNLPNQYGYVLLCAAIMGFSILLIGFFIAGRVRGKIFTEAYLKQNFGAEHQRVTGNQIKAGGYPDTGNGFYAKNLSYEQWYEFNNAQRAHMNFVEWIASCLVFLLIGGLYFPIPAAAVGLGVVVARFIYACGYSSGGPTGRLIGALANDVLVLAQFVLAVISSVYFLKGDQFPN